MQLLLELSHDVAPGLGRGAAALVMPGPPLRLYCRVPPLRLQLPGAATPPLTRFLQAAAALAPIEAGPSEPECPQPPPPSPQTSQSVAGLAAAPAPEGLSQLGLDDADEWGHAEELGEGAAEEEAAAAELTLAAEFSTPPRRPLPPPKRMSTRGRRSSRST